MLKFNKGWIGNNEGIKKDIVVKAVSPNTLKDSLIGGCIVLIGITYLTITAFKNGMDKYEDAEFKTFDDLNLLEDL